MKKIYSSLISLFIVQQLYSSGVRSGEINFSHISGFTYEFNVKIYTNDSAINSIILMWGDGTLDTLSSFNSTDDSILFLNECSGVHTFPGSGIYVVSTTVNYLMDDIANIQNIANQPFYTEDTLNILDPQLFGYSSSPVVFNPPIIFGNVNELITYNPNAYDPDGDSMSFSLVPFFAPGYSFPLATNSIGVESATGQFTWDQPEVFGNYAVAILIKEYRLGHLIGTELLETVITITNSALDVPEHFSNSFFSIFPNPVYDFLNIITDDPYGNATLEIINSQGQKVLTEFCDPTGTALDLSFLPSGIYYLLIAKDNCTASERFVKQ